MDKERVLKVLIHNNYYINSTARQLNIGRGKLYSFIKKNFPDIPKRTGGAVKKYKYDNQSMINIYYKMKSRCYNKNNSDYFFYGERGILVHKDWLDNRDSFYEYCTTLPNAFIAGFSIDRINNNGNYEPGNIRFVEHVDQCNNRRSNRNYIYNGKEATIAIHARESGLKWEFIRDRLKLGWTIKEAIEIPKGGKRDKN